MNISNKEWNRVSPEDMKVVRKYMNVIPVKLGSMAKELGIIVKRCPTLPRSVSGQIKRLETGIYEIKINKFESLARQRFTLAHEISHFLLHRNEINNLGEIADNVLYRSGASQTIEYEANRLAAQIIMPDSIISQKLGALGTNFTDTDICRLAKEFGVSKAAMKIRMEDQFDGGKIWRLIYLS
ncbi:ImmA/IrrE family metallo-endopeptidase [Bartonella apis]|uniref:ImmA/IrrE family metallo-endopeptidase n=1 Tax=Bartonella apis TaxID=1686310 RepID=UPI003BB75543